MIKGILFDYGGTIDTNGQHWGEVLWKAYEANGVGIGNEAFRKAYSHGEYMLAVNPLIKPEHDFFAVLEIKIEKQFDFLIQNGHLPDADYEALIKKIAGDCNQLVLDTLVVTTPVLEYLSGKFPLVLVSNFYGNINTVLSCFGISQYFKSIVESAIVGVRKPNPAIFSMGVGRQQFAADECVVIGDSYNKDIAPGKLAGCETIWLKGAGWGDDPANTSGADRIIKSLEELKDII